MSYRVTKHLKILINNLILQFRDIFKKQILNTMILYIRKLIRKNFVK